MSNKLVLFFLFFWFFRILISYLAPFLSFFPDFNDTYLFSNIIVNNQFPEEQSLGVGLFYYLTYPMRFFLLFDITNFVLFQNFVYFISMLILWRSYLIYLENNYLNISSSTIHSSLFIYIFLFSTYPASVMYISVPLREFLLVFNIAIFIYGMILCKYKSDWSILVFAFILIFFVRPQLFIVFVFSFSFIYFENRILKFLLLFVSPFILLNIFSIIFYDISPELLSKIRTSWGDSHSDNVYGLFEWSNWFDVLTSFPLLLLQYILSPLPILHDRNPFSMLAAFIDVIFIIIVALLCVFSCVFSKSKKYMLKNALRNPFFIFLMSITFMSALWEAYIGGAVRHRVSSIIIFIPFAAILINNFTIKTHPLSKVS